jgi:hypothetical protein
MVVSGATTRRGGRTQVKNRTSYPSDDTRNWQIPWECGDFRRGGPIWRSAHSCSRPRTVEWHLRNVFGKLGTASRQELRAGANRTGQPAVLAPASVTGALAAIDVQDLAGDVGRGLQEENAVDDVADLAGPSERGKPAAEVVIAFPRVHRGLDDAR